MSHKAGADFFHTKREWSLRKDLILENYLVPYLPKIATQQRPVLIIDGFAGAGRFDDDQPGSPVIICEAVRKRRASSSTGSYQVWLVEQDPVLFKRLQVNTSMYRDFVTVHNSTLREVLPAIQSSISKYNVFLYLDPFTVTGLAWNSLDQIFQQVNRQQSIECLINFNVQALARAACFALGKSFKDGVNDDNMVGESASTIATVNESLGGDWWQDRFRNAATFASACKDLTSGYVDKLRDRFAEVCSHEIKERDAHQIPKYVLVFGSRHPAALELMNDAMAKSLKLQADFEAPSEATLFETRSTNLVPDQSELDESILRFGRVEQPRKELIMLVVRMQFGKYPWSKIRSRIEELLKQGRMRSKSGRTKINDDELIRTV